MSSEVIGPVDIRGRNALQLGTGQAYMPIDIDVVGCHFSAWRKRLKEGHLEEGHVRHGLSETVGQYALVVALVSR